MTTNPLSQVLIKLDGMKASKIKHAITSLERAFQFFSDVLMILAGISFFFLVILAAWHKFISELPEVLKLMALFFGCVAMALPLISMVIGILLAGISLYKIQEKSLEQFIQEVECHQNWITSLRTYPPEILEEAAKYLRLKISRMKGRISLFFGSPDKAALFSLAGMGWLVFKELSPKNKDALLSNFSLGVLNVETMVFYAIAFLTGIALGSVIMNGMIQRYSYQLDILDLARSSS